MATLFISDLHLSEQRPQVVSYFLDYLQTMTDRHVEVLYILGDLFEVWIGDDAASAMQHKVLAAIKCCHDNGIAIRVMRGNRDFLYGPRFRAMSGAVLLDDFCVIDLQGEPTLLLHGDTLCIDDLAYQQFRSRVRDPHWQMQFLALPIPQRLAMAQTLREVSQQETQNKSIDIMDVNPDAVAATMKKYGVRRLIHGHTHRPHHHHLTVKGQEYQRIVLGDWTDVAHVLYVNNDQCSLEKLDIDSGSLSQTHKPSRSTL